jgi:hypothetical protein
MKNSVLRVFGAEDKIVIGEGMDRVIAHADNVGADYYGGLGREGTEFEYKADNTAFIVEKMDQGYTIIDIGASPLKPNYPLISSPYYELELKHIGNWNGPGGVYEHYQPDRSSFTRWARDMYGNPN